MQIKQEPMGCKKPSAAGFRIITGMYIKNATATLYINGRAIAISTSRGVNKSALLEVIARWEDVFSLDGKLAGVRILNFNDVSAMFIRVSKGIYHPA